MERISRVCLEKILVLRALGKNELCWIGIRAMYGCQHWVVLEEGFLWREKDAPIYFGQPWWWGAGQKGDSRLLSWEQSQTCSLVGRHQTHEHTAWMMPRNNANKVNRVLTQPFSPTVLDLTEKPKKIWLPAQQAGERPSSRQCQSSRDHFWRWSNVPAWGCQGAIHAHREQRLCCLRVRHAGSIRILGKSSIGNVLTKLKVHEKQLQKHIGAFSGYTDILHR